MASNITSADFNRSSEIARRALEYIGQFSTPPTPDVFEVWYAFAEGDNSELNEALTYLIKELKAVTTDDIRLIRQRFFPEAMSPEESVRASDELVGEVGGLQMIVSDHISVSHGFGESLGGVMGNMSVDAPASDARNCIQTVLDCNEQMQGQLNQLNTRLEESQRQLNSMRTSLLESQKLLLIDPVSSVGNRRFFDTVLLKMLRSPVTDQLHQFLLLVDLDRFKQINDTLGHSIGDDVLRHMATKLQEFSTTASVSRYGGDEFAIFLASADELQGKRFAETIREYFARTSLVVADSGENIGLVTTSIGVARRRADDDRESWIKRADKLLYSAKSSGRNCVMVERDLKR